MDLKDKILKLIEAVGREKAGKRLVAAGIHIDTAMKLLNGTYNSEPRRELREAIEKAVSQ
jgi:hypothetical protein